MRRVKKLSALLMSLLLAAALSGCDFLPSMGFDDYDVSSYIQALLDSSYHNAHEAFMAAAQTDQANAQQNNTSTVENAAINFCNAYNLSPTDEQLATLEEIMGLALSQSRYTVKDEQKVSTGYYLEVEVSPIVNFMGLAEEFATLRGQAQDEANAANRPEEPVSTPEPEDEDGDDDWDEWGEEEPTPSPSPTPEPTPEPPKVDAYELYIDKVLEKCREQIAQIRYQEQNITVPLDILQTAAGELQLDLNQLDTIDSTVLLFN